MSTTTTALLVGLTLGIVAVFGGFGGFLLVVFFGAVGLGVGRVLEGELDLSALTGRFSDRT
ncbi:MAG: hypothetical protein WBG89_03945, partial [Ornithinimicrobium sp.]